MLDKLWDDVVAGPTPDRGLGKLRNLTLKPSPLIVNDGGESAAESGGGAAGAFNRSISMPATPGTPTTPKTPKTPLSASAARENVWRSVFHPGSNLATKGIGAAVFDKPSSPNSPTVYDWLYSGETRSKHH